jgi:hypothetical protein
VRRLFAFSASARAARELIDDFVRRQGGTPRD